MAQRRSHGRFILLFERFLKGSKKRRFFDAHSDDAKIEPNRALEPQGPPPKKNENTTFVAYKAPKIKAPRPAPNYQRNTRKKGLNIRKKILTRLWAFGPANLMINLLFNPNSSKEQNVFWPQLDITFSLILSKRSIFKETHINQNCCG